MERMETALEEAGKCVQAGQPAASVRIHRARVTKRTLAERYHVGVRTIENWQYSGIICARFEKRRAVFDVVECDERLLRHPKRHDVR